MGLLETWTLLTTRGPLYKRMLAALAEASAVLDATPAGAANRAQRLALARFIEERLHEEGHPAFERLYRRLLATSPALRAAGDGASDDELRAAVAALLDETAAWLAARGG